ncbi:MAG: hypothetical protein HY348_10680 [Nitrospira defluvii]|nr:hypothetical protein [Nitrospira defluvii]
MHTPQLDPSVASASPSPPCRHKRLVDRVLTENGQETGKVRCLECGEIIADHTPSTAQ